jgi:hypothetical protein
VEVIGEQKIWTYSGDEAFPEQGKCAAVRNGAGRTVKNFMELATRIAELQFLNRDFVLLFRGQSRDFKDENGTSLKPSILRSSADEAPPSMSTLRNRYGRLKTAEVLLVDEYRRQELPDLERLQRQQILRWAILQHYEICETPLLDVTHSLRIAASFATKEDADEGFIFVLAVPHISGAITASAEAGLQIVRLASVCPPAALRPHIQEGYLLAQYPEITGIDRKELFPHYETDFGRRLIAKFKFDPARFWLKSEDFPRVREVALYPREQDDPLLQLAKKVRKRLGLG